MPQIPLAMSRGRAYSWHNLIGNLLAAGDSLAEAQREAERGLAFARKIRFGHRDRQHRDATCADPHTPRLNGDLRLSSTTASSTRPRSSAVCRVTPGWRSLRAGTGPANCRHVSLLETIRRPLTLRRMRNGYSGHRSALLKRRKLASMVHSAMRRPAMPRSLFNTGNMSRL